jgi:CRISPR-associated protein Cmr3
MTQERIRGFIEIEPIDGLFVNSGRPNAMGEAHVLQGIFPPLPTNFYGLLRDIFIDRLNNIINRGDLNEKETDPTLDLKIEGIYIQYYKNRENNASYVYIPKPMDMVFKRSDNHKTIDDRDCYLLELGNNDFKDCFSSNPFNSNLLTFSDDKPEDKENLFISIRNVEKKKFSAVIDLTEHTTKEPHTGIKRDYSTKTVDEGHLYSIVFSKPKDYNFLIEYSISEEKVQNVDKKSDQGIKSFCAEGKKVYYNFRDDDFSSKLKWQESTEIKKGDTIRLVLLTPALFKKGWKPSVDLIKSFFGEEKVEMINAVVGKEQVIAGFDMIKKEGKPRRYAVPAGSVYYFKADNDLIMKTGLQKKRFTEEFEVNSEFYARQGFGITYLAKT